MSQYYLPEQEGILVQKDKGKWYWSDCGNLLYKNEMDVILVGTYHSQRHQPLELNSYVLLDRDRQYWILIDKEPLGSMDRVETYAFISNREYATNLLLDLKIKVDCEVSWNASYFDYFGSAEDALHQIAKGTDTHYRKVPKINSYEIFIQRTDGIYKTAQVYLDKGFNGWLINRYNPIEEKSLPKEAKSFNTL